MRLNYASVQAIGMRLRDDAVGIDTLSNVWMMFVPRIIWPDKPIYASPGIQFYTLITGNEGTSVGISVFGDVYWQFGWMGIFIIIPMIALLYAGLTPNGPDCGVSGQLAINPITGEAESCDGDASPFFSLGAAVYEAQCVACHGAGGGGGVGPSFLGGAVLQTFSACTDHIEWVSIGSNDWPDATYGDTEKPAGGSGVMPGYQDSLTAQEIAAVALYERVAFGGEDIATGEASCGLVAGAEGAEG